MRFAVLQVRLPRGRAGRAARMSQVGMGPRNKRHELKVPPCIVWLRQQYHARKFCRTRPSRVAAT